MSLSQYQTDSHPLFEVFIDETDITLWKIIFSGEKETPYSGRCWILYMEFPETYPQSPMIVRFITPIYHCNINNDGKICHDILNDQWNPNVTVMEVMNKIVELIARPNPLNSLDSVKGTLYQDNRTLYFSHATSHSSSHGKLKNDIMKDYNLNIEKKKWLV